MFFFFQENKTQTYVCIKSLLHTQHPGSPSLLLNSNHLHIPNLNPMQWPIRRNLKLDLQLMFVHGICSNNLVNRLSYFY